MNFKTWLEMHESRAAQAADQTAINMADGGDIDSVFDGVVVAMGLNKSEEAEAIDLVKGMIASGRIVLRKAAKTEAPIEEGPEWPLTHDQMIRYGRNECHYLTAALLRLRPSGEAWGLYGSSGPIHSVYRMWDRQVFLDAFGVMDGMPQLEERRTWFLFSEASEWRPMAEDELRRLTTLDRARRVRRATTVARKVMAAGEMAMRNKM